MAYMTEFYDWMAFLMTTQFVYRDQCFYYGTGYLWLLAMAKEQFTCPWDCQTTKWYIKGLLARYSFVFILFVTPTVVGK